MESLTQGLRDLASRRAAKAENGRRPARIEPSGGAQVPASEIPDAEILSVGRGTTVSIRREVADLTPGEDIEGRLREGLEKLARVDSEKIYPGLRAARGRTVEEIVILDLETTGFWGCPIFLVGMILVDDGALVTRQFLARDYPEEAPMLRAAADFLDDRALLVSFNGKSYDAPCLKERCTFHGVDSGIEDTEHVDILHVARRRFREELPDCRLQTLEREIVGWHRTGDVPSSEVPAAYHHFAATGDVYELLPVLHHSRVDVLTTTKLFAELAADPPPPIPRKKKKRKEAAG